MKGLAFTAVILLVTAIAIFMFSQLKPAELEGENQTVPFVPLFSPSESLASLSDSELNSAREQGIAIYNRFQCIGCHVDEGRALKKLIALGNKYNVETLSAYLKRPNPPMPLFPLSDTERRQLAIYLIDRYPGEEIEPASEGEVNEEAKSAPAS